MQRAPQQQQAAGHSGPVRGTSRRPCPACEADRAVPLPRFDREGWRIVRCGGCGFVYLVNPPGYEALEEDFAWEKTFRSEHEYRLEAMPLLYRADLATRWRHRIGRRPDAENYRMWFGEGRLLNVGCGAATAEVPGFVQYGIEISRELAAEADANLRRQGGHCIHAPALEGIRTFEDGFFDGVVLRSFLEHEMHPLPLLREVRRVLKPTGAAYVRVPNFAALGRRILGRKWPGFRYPDHVNYFTRRSLEDMAQKAGLELRLLNPLRLPFDDNINALLFPRAGETGRARQPVS